ncbi:hypothetical protein COLO4_36666 [Corchorus olitorius]|uniref:Uncharacterized protein n=1 Tax=Corchorus olitorius TaxID=93759 RepID=A0A1R3G6U9_9ROSI|nr:hypothetical protein COLO4_36666 [Corchorus olitorius]
MCVHLCEEEGRRTQVFREFFDESGVVERIRSGGC